MRLSADRLDGTERTHLYGPARPARQPARGEVRPEAAGDAEQLRPSVRNMIESLGDVPALMLGRFVDALAWNRVGHALLAGHLPFDAPERGAAERPNVARMMFLDPHTRAAVPGPAEHAAGHRGRSAADCRTLARHAADGPLTVPSRRT
ncbi:hypothetical protein ACH4SK_42950 [Streptomyces inhibens]|uniref:MmyB family transcriptional regulator n=1 Tax=Streptomyces inhibens TaxID=2293571 RepID=UPI0037A6A683